MFTLFEFNIDFEGENSIEVGTIVAGSGNGPAFQGSFFLFYIETDPYHDPDEKHIIWDFLWLRQLWTK
jgi:hypothetical protein